MPWPYRVALWLGARVAPGMRPTGRGLGRQASDNIAMLRANARDPLFIKKTRIDAIRGLVDLMDEALASPPRITTPVLYLYGAKDQIIPKAPTIQAMVAFDPDKARIARAYYPDSWHMMLRDKGAAVPLTDIAAFIADPDAPLPSEADRDALVRLSAAAKGAIPATSAGHDRPGVSR
jgi:alpha-beta hydrolase superfamily lysophospholipase